MRPLTVIVTLVLLSGCLQASPQGTESTQRVAPAYPDESELAFSGQDCETTISRVMGPAMLAPGSAPDAWESPNQVTSTTDIWLIECERISAPGIDRGPITLMFEAHSKHATPEACRRGEGNVPVTVGHLAWSDDPSIAQMIENQTFVEAATVNYTPPSSNAPWHTWRFDEGTTSRHQRPTGEPSGSLIVEEYALAFDVGDHISFVLLRFIDPTATQNSETLAIDMNEPHLQWPAGLGDVARGILTHSNLEVTTWQTNYDCSPLSS